MSAAAVAITGMGLLTPLGGSREENWSNLRALKTGIAHYPQPDLPSAFQYLGKVNGFTLPEPIPAELGGEMRFLNRGALLGFAAACEAVRQSDIKLSGIPPSRRALYVASGDLTKVGYEFLFPAIQEGTAGGFRQMDHQKLNNALLGKVSPFFLLESLSNNLFSFLAASMEFKGPNTSLASLSPAGAQALELAYRSIRHGRADVALAVGYGNCITPIPLYELADLGLLSKCTDGVRSFKPFDRRRDGFIAGEGGAALLLEDYAAACRRGATIWGTLRGASHCIELSGGHNLTVPSKVITRSFGAALAEAGCRIADLGYISAHGSATQKGDRAELSAIRDALEAEQAQVPICSLKPYTGHMGAAGDLADIIQGTRAVMEDTVPATLNFTEPDKEFSHLKISSRHQPCTKNTFVSISYGLGGQSSCMVVSAGASS
jgi:3-oxoacyl-[acyl-carrier-protein] synthase II